MATTQTEAAPAATAQAGEDSLFDQILSQSRIARTDSEKDRAKDLMAELVNQVTEGALVMSKDAITSLDARIADLDKLISDQLSAIMHLADFQQMEGSWRGLKYLVDNSETSTTLKIKVFNVTKKE
ncbi:MAG: type VI secretion system contractile sheath large subunit, partial [Comamonas sp.]